MMMIIQRAMQPDQVKNEANEEDDEEDTYGKVIQEEYIS
jgi:hypothetical protein